MKIFLDEKVIIPASEISYIYRESDTKIIIYIKSFAGSHIDITTKNKEDCDATYKNLAKLLEKL